jgi:FkbM family methyltransferase
VAVLKKATKGLFRLLGLEIQRMPAFQTYEWLRKEHIGTVFDIGANAGQFARYIHELLPESLIYSFEPLPQCYERLADAMRGIRQFKAFGFALSDECGRVPMYRNRFSPSSSLLPMAELHKEAFPYTKETAIEWTEVRRLDDVAAELDIIDDVLVKMDVQGFEGKVIRGGEKTIARASVLILETSFRPLYVGQPLFDTIYDILRAKGFTFMGCEGPMRNLKDGSILQCDSIFVRRDGRNGLTVTSGD